MKTGNEEIDKERELTKIKNRKFRGLVTKVKNACKPEKEGINVVKYKLEFLENNPKTLLPVEELNHYETVQAYKAGIESHLDAFLQMRYLELKKWFIEWFKSGSGKIQVVYLGNHGRVNDIEELVMKQIVLIESVPNNKRKHSRPAQANKNLLIKIKEAIEDESFVNTGFKTVKFKIFEKKIKEKTKKKKKKYQ